MEDLQPLGSFAARQAEPAYVAKSRQAISSRRQDQFQKAHCQFVG
jgi:hypothetical protein